MLCTNVKILKYKNKNKPFIDCHHLTWAWPREPGKKFCATLEIFPEY